MAKKQQPVVWKAAPEEHDYPAAASYLSLLGDLSLVAELVGGLRAAPVTHFKAKDILRAARLALLDVSNPHVATDLRSVRKGRPLSPILLVAGDLTSGTPVQVADGYHRVCASYYVDENTDIPCRLVAFPGRRPAPEQAAG